MYQLVIINANILEYIQMYVFTNYDLERKSVILVGRMLNIGVPIFVHDFL